LISDAKSQIRGIFSGASEKPAKIVLGKKNEIRSDQFGFGGKDLLDLKLEEHPIMASEFHRIPGKDEPRLRNALTDGDFSGFQGLFFRNHKGVIGSDDGIVIVPPKAPAPGLDAPDLLDRLQIAERYLLLSAGDGFLDNQLRGILQDKRGFPFYGMSKKQNGGKGENKKGINEYQGEIFPFAPQEGGEGKIQDIFLSFPAFHVIF
jgi:hypothetical protein